MTTTTSHKAAALTGASALAMYKAAETTADKLRAAAAMAEVLERAATPRAKTPKGPADLLNAENLFAVLKRMKGIVDGRQTMPILAHVLLEAMADGLTITATDLDKIYIEKMRAPGLGTWKAAVPLKDLMGLLRGLKGNVGLELDETSDSIGVTVGGDRARLPVLPAGDFPLMEHGKRLSTAILPAALIVEPLRLTAPAISTEETRYYLNGAYMHVLAIDGERRLAFAATDGARLIQHVAQTPCAPGLAEMAGIIITRKTVAWIIANVTDDEVQVDLYDGQIWLTTATGTLGAKLIDGNFPDYQRAMPLSDRTWTRLDISDTSAFAASVARLGARTQQRSTTVTIATSETGGEVRARARSLDGASFDAVLPAIAHGEEREASFNARVLGEVLALCPTADMLIKGGGHDPAVIIFPDPALKAVVMPLRA